MEELDDYIDRVRSLPPAPQILPQLLSLLNDADVDSERVVNLITYDPSLTANVLQVCNSVYFGAATPASDLSQAVTRLGFKEIYRMVASLSGARVLSVKRGYGLNEGELWKHSVTTAMAAQLMAQDLGDDENLVFTAALLHDLGKIVLSGALEQNYAKMLEDVAKNQHSLLDTEKRLLGVQHAELGGRLLARWQFPSNIVAGVWFHHNPIAAAPHNRLASYIYLGNMIAHFIGHSCGHSAVSLRGREDALEVLGIDGDAMPKYMIRTYENFEAVDSLLQTHR